MTKDKTRESYGRLSGVVGLFLNFGLFVLKLVIGLLSGSIAVIADAVNNLFDTMSSLVTFFGFKFAGKPADKEHPFGHGRFEDIANLVIAISIIFLGIEFIRNSIENTINPPQMSSGPLSIILLVIAFFVKFWMYLFNRKLGKKIGSDTLMTVAKDSRNDCVITLATILSLVVITLFDLYIDGYVGILVSILLLRTGFSAAKQTLSAFMGRPVDKATADNIKQIVMQQNGIIAVHDLIVHNYGPARNVATIHAEMPMHMKIAEAHRIIDAAEKAVLNQLDIHLTIHMDPVDTENRRLVELKEAVRIYLAHNFPKANAHEFELTESENELIFELEIPHGTECDAKGAMLEGIKQIVCKNDPACKARVDVEFGFVADE